MRKGIHLREFRLSDTQHKGLGIISPTIDEHLLFTCSILLINSEFKGMSYE